MLKGIARHRFACCLVAGAMAFVGPAPSVTSRATEGIKASSMRGVPRVPERPVRRPDQAWVPDRWIPVPGEPAPVHVPGRWERRVSEREFYVPPATIFRPTEGRGETFPAGLRPPARERLIAP